MDVSVWRREKISAWGGDWSALMEHLSIQRWPGIDGHIPCNHSLTCGCLLFSRLCCADLTNTLASPCGEHSTSFKRETRNKPVQPRAEAACPRGGRDPCARRWAQLSPQGTAGPPARPASTARCLCCSPGACCTYKGFVQIFSVRHVGCGGLGDINQSSPAGDKGVRLINSGDKSAAVSFGNSSALTGV